MFFQKKQARQNRKNQARSEMGGHQKIRTEEGQVAKDKRRQSEEMEKKQAKNLIF